MARKQSFNPAIPIVFVVIALLLIAGIYWFYTHPQPGTQGNNATPQSADLISDDRIIYGGIPRARAAAGSEVAMEILKNTAYMVGYSESRRDPLWAAYRVFHTDHPYDYPRPSAFSPDPRTSDRVKSSDFTGSGYDRGHMAPNKSIVFDYGKEAQEETFLLSNVCPQSKKLNEEVWERLEQDERSYADTMEEVWVIDGPVFADLNGGATDHLASGIAVPTAFFKILIDEQGRKGGPPRAFAVIMPQEVKGTELPQQFLTSISEIEKETHLEFFWKLDAATRAELENGVHKMW